MTKPLVLLTAAALAAGVGLTHLALAETDQAAADKTATAATDTKAEITKLVIEDVKKGTGEETQDGKPVQVHYTGWLYDPKAENNAGTKFDSSRDRGQPFTFTLGAGQVIKGWDEGVAGMKVGGQRRLIIPPDMGYGAQGAGDVIPPNSTLVFDVELLDVSGDADNK